MSILGAVGKKTVMLGMIDVGDNTVETVPALVDRAREALRHIPAGQLILAPDCGMLELSRASARQKLVNLSLAARRHQRGGRCGLRRARSMSQQTVRGAFVTAAEIAERAGVSRSAVSRTFTPGASVSEPVRARVLEAADELGYRVNRLARSLNHARSNLVGLVGADLQQPFHAESLATLSGALLEDGFQCMLLNAANAERDMGILIERVLEYRVCAIVVMNGTPPSRIVKECVKNGVPVILVNKPMPGAGGRYRGHRSCRGWARRGGVPDRGRLPQARRRLECGADLEPARRIECIPRPCGRGWRAGADLAAGCDRLLGRPRSGAGAARQGKIDGAFCVTDLLALGFLDAARLDRGRCVPQDLSVIGFDDIPQAAWLAYQLTTFRQPVQLAHRPGDAGHPATRRDTGLATPCSITLPASLVVRCHRARSERRRGNGMTRPRVIAHRGSSAAHAENSWAAFEAAVADGADAIECDVQATRDGVLVMRHDLMLGKRPVRSAWRPRSRPPSPDWSGWPTCLTGRRKPTSACWSN